MDYRLLCDKDVPTHTAGLHIITSDGFFYLCFDIHYGIHTSSDNQFKVPALTMVSQ